jgi:hypothetical protein
VALEPLREKWERALLGQHNMLIQLLLILSVLILDPLCSKLRECKEALAIDLLHAGSGINISHDAAVAEVPFDEVRHCFIPLEIFPYLLKQPNAGDKEHYYREALPQTAALPGEPGHLIVELLEAFETSKVVGKLGEYVLGDRGLEKDVKNDGVKGE